MDLLRKTFSKKKSGPVGFDDKKNSENDFVSNKNYNQNKSLKSNFYNVSTFEKDMRTDTPIQQKDISSLIIPAHVFLGDGKKESVQFAHIAFTDQTNAEIVAKGLFNEDLVVKVPNVKFSNLKYHHYSEKTCFLRIHISAYSKIANTYRLPSWEELKPYKNYSISNIFKMTDKSQKENISSLITRDNVFLPDSKNGQAWFAHIIFKDKNDADKVAKVLANAKLVREAPTLNLTNCLYQPYPEGTYFLRIHNNAYPGIAEKYVLPAWDKLKEYTKNTIDINAFIENNVISENKINFSNN